MASNHTICKVSVGAVGASWPGSTTRQVNLHGVYEPDAEKNSENHTFFKASPSVSMAIGIDNPGAQDFFEQGQEYYCVFIPAKGASARDAVRRAGEVAEEVRK